MPSAFPRVWSWGVPPPSTVPQKTGLSTRGLVKKCVSPGRVNGLAFGRSSVSSFKFWQLWCKRNSLSVSGRAELPSAGRIAVPGTNSARVGFRARWACARIRCNMDRFRLCDHSRQVTFTAIHEINFWIACARVPFQTQSLATFRCVGVSAMHPFLFLAFHVIPVSGWAGKSRWTTVSLGTACG